MGRTDIGDALDRLDRLTQDEVQMAAAQGLKATHGVGENVQRIDDRVHGVDKKVQGVDEKVQGVDEKVQGVGEKVQGVDDRVRGIDDKMGLVIYGAQFVSNQSSTCQWHSMLSG